MAAGAAAQSDDAGVVGLEVDAGAEDPDPDDGGTPSAGGASGIGGSGGAGGAGGAVVLVRGRQQTVDDLKLPEQGCHVAVGGGHSEPAHAGWILAAFWLCRRGRHRQRRTRRAAAVLAGAGLVWASGAAVHVHAQPAPEPVDAGFSPADVARAAPAEPAPSEPGTTSAPSSDAPATGNAPAQPAAASDVAPEPESAPPAAVVPADDDSTLGTVIVTGVRGGPPRTVAESPAPIDVVSSDDLKRTGRAELSEAIAKVLPSLNFSSNQAGITSIVRPVTNRGLGPAYTLVLVNGKRRHNGAQVSNATGDTSGVNAVDLDMIPVSSVDYIEVLKDSAAAQYGSDAVAGVINVVLKKDSEGGRIGLTGGRLYGGNGNLNYGRAEADVGLPLGKRGTLHIGGDARFRGGSYWNSPATDPPYWPDENPKNATWNGDAAHNGDPRIGAVNGFYNLDLELGSFTVYSFGTIGGRWTEAGNNLRRPDGLANFSDIYPDGYFPLSNTAELDLQVVAGVKGQIAGAKVDLSTSYGRSNVLQYSNLALNPSLGPSSPRSFDDLATYRFEQWVQNLDITRGFEIGLPEPFQVSVGAELRVDAFSTFAGDELGYTNGEYRFEAGDQENDPNVGKLASPGAQGAVVLRPSDEVRLSRNVLAGYVDLGIYPFKAWYNGLAARVEHYDDSSGTTVGGKYNTRLDIVKQLALRGTVGTGFRAPSLTQIGYSQTDNRTATNPLTGASGPSLSVLPRTDSPLARALGAKPLVPERSVNFALGAVVQPLEHFNVTVDAYQVSIDRRIGRTDQLLGPAIAPILIDNDYTGSEFVRYFANQTDTRTRGIDIVADWSGPIGELGNLSLSLAFNYNRTQITRIAPTPPELLNLERGPDSNLEFLGRITAGELSVNLPTNKLIAGARWRKGPVRVNLALTRYGSYNFVRSQMVAQDVRYGAKALFDAELTVSVLPSLDLTIGANNLLDVRPDRNGPIDAATGSAALVYGPSPFAPSGGFYYGKVVYNL
ncbi:MAG: TonB-dependent receptor plug domain-containing protein [Polyangiales bacterium]